MNTTDFILASLPTLTFNRQPPISWEAFRALCGDARLKTPPLWVDLETQFKNAIATARDGEKYKRPAKGCSVFWRNRVMACFQEKNPLKRETLLDKVWWDAAAELTDVSNPLGIGALATYAVRLKILLKRNNISEKAGNEAFDRLTAETKISSFDLEGKIL